MSPSETTLSKRGRAETEMQLKERKAHKAQVIQDQIVSVVFVDREE